MPLPIFLKPSTAADSQQLGSLGAALVEALKVGSPVADTIVIPNRFFTQIYDRNQLDQVVADLVSVQPNEYDASHIHQILADKMRSAHVPSELRNKLATTLHAQFGHRPVRVLPSPDNSDHAIDGHQPAVSGDANIIHKILDTWAQQQAKQIIANQGLPASPFAVVVQDSPQAIMAGTTITRHPRPSQKNHLYFELYHPQYHSKTGKRFASYDLRTNSFQLDPVLSLTSFQKQQLAKLAQSLWQLKQHRLSHLSADWTLSKHGSVIHTVKPHHEHIPTATAASSVNSTATATCLCPGKASGQVLFESGDTVLDATDKIVVTPQVSYQNAPQLARAAGIITLSSPSPLIQKTFKDQRIPMVKIGKNQLSQIPNNTSITLDANTGTIKVDTQPTTRAMGTPAVDVWAVGGNPATAELVASQPVKTILFDASQLLKEHTPNNLEKTLRKIHQQTIDQITFLTGSGIERVLYRSPRIMFEDEQDGIMGWLGQHTLLEKELTFVGNLAGLTGCEVAWIPPDVRTVGEWHILRQIQQKQHTKTNQIVSIWLPISVPAQVEELPSYLEYPPEGMLVDTVRLDYRFHGLPINDTLQIGHPTSANLLATIIEKIGTTANNYGYTGMQAVLLDRHDQYVIDHLLGHTQALIVRPQHVGPIKQQVLR